MKLSQQLQKEIEISCPYKPIPEQGLEDFKQEQSMNFIKKLTFLSISKKPFLGLTLEQFKTYC